ncbi:abcB3, partial [Symbiodinium sp. KB8]
ELVAVDENAKDADKKLEAWKMTLPEVPLSRVWQYTAPEGGSVLAGFLFAVVAGSITPLFALVFTEVLAVFYNPDSSELEADTLFYMGMFFAVAGAGTISLLTYAGGHMTTRLQMDAYRSMLRQDVGFFDLPQHSAGRLVGRLSKDAQSVRAITGVNMSMTLQQVSTISVGVVIAFLASWRVALVVLAIMPLLGLAAKLNFKYRSGFAKANVEENKEMAHLTTEAIINIRTVQSLGLERALLRQFASSQDPVNAQAVSSAYFVGVVSGFSMFVMLGSYAL